MNAFSYGKCPGGGGGSSRGGSIPTLVCCPGSGTAIWKARTTGAGPGRRLLAPSTPMLTPLSRRSRVRPKRRSLDSPAEPEEHAGEQGGRGRTARSPPDPWKRERYRLDETARGSSTDKKVLDGMKVISGGCWKQGIYPSKTG